MPRLRLAKTGYDAETGNVENMVYDSNYSALKIATQGTLQITLTPNGDGSYNENTGSVAHNLGYKPIVKLGAVIGSQAIEFHGMTIFTNSGILDFYGDEALPIIASEVTTTTINFRFISPFDVGSSATVTINYIIFLDEF